LINVGEVRKGINIELDGQLFTVVEFEHIKMGRGGALIRLKIRNLRSGYTAERTFPASEKFRRAYLDRSRVQFQYQEDNLFNFMDTETFEQVPLNRDQIADEVPYLKENLVVDLLSYAGDPIGIELPITIELRVTQTDPGFKGDTATGGTKPAIVETGLRVNVPLFVVEGDLLKIDTRSGEYVERVY
jgi:elongation factor P